LQENTNPEEGDNVVIQAEVTGALSVELMATINPFPSHFISIPMYDDGEHDDGNANDNIFGAIIPYQESGNHVKYYIRASNDDALVLNPKKAEREFYQYTIDIGAEPGTSVVINEINYNSADDFETEDWVELYNPTDNIIDLSNWTFKDENDDHLFTIPEDVSLAPDQYIVLCENADLFQTFFPEVDNYIGDLGYGLDGSGELIRLFDPSGILVDAVDYDDSYPWPEEADGEGPTLELIDPTQDNALGVNWSASEGHGSPGVINTSLSIQNITIVPDGFMVFNNYPNPFNPTTIISYVLPIDASVTITIHDIMGRKVRTLVNSRQTAGFKTIQWNATNDNRQPVAAGIYIYTVQSGEFRQSRKMLLLK